MNFKNVLMEALRTEPIDNWLDMLYDNLYLATAVSLMEEIEKLGGEALIVGGAVRDIILKQPAHDIDIATNVDIQTLAKHFKTHDIGKSQDFGILSIHWGNYTFEVAHYRSEQGYSDNRRPDQVTQVKSFEKDTERRDLTFNALGLDKNGIILDYQNGIEDLRNGVVRTVGAAKDRFIEDSLRILRVARFAAKLGFQIDPDTKKAMIELGYTVDNVSAERVHDELFKASTSGSALANYLEHLDEVGLLERILPEIKIMQKHHHHVEHHPEGAKVRPTSGGDWKSFDWTDPTHRDKSKYELQKGSVYDHLIAVLRASQSNDPITNQAMLFHDVGKPPSAKPFSNPETGEEGESFHGHEAAGVPVFQKIANRLKYSNKEKEAIIFAMEHHMWGHQLKSLAKSKVLRMRQSPHWDVLRHTMRADDASRGEPIFNPQEFEDRIAYAEELYKSFGETQAFEKKMSALINGNLIMQLIPGIKGHEIGRIKTATRDWIVSKDFQVTPEEVTEYVRSLS
jgi:tRNA nucleotidyltransferase/poly(A) polymerase